MNHLLIRDPERLSVLRDLAILDTPPEPAYDDIARLASICCSSPVAAVNFVEGDRHWTKAIVGVDGGQGSNVSADLSFCAATIATDGGVLCVSDTSESEEWREHPFVTGPPHLKFYAGASIVVAGQPVGVVCVFGDQPRDLGDGEQQALVALAAQASAQLDLRQRNADLRDLAVTDPLTGLANRTLLEDRLEMAVAQSARDGSLVGVLFCDVDDFKLVNDRWGHETGDRLLCTIGDRLRAGTRVIDTVARFAGDEFVIVCPGLESASELTAIVERIDRFVHLADAPETLVTPGLSIGTATFEEGDTAATLLKCADDAMYAAKSARRTFPGSMG